MTAAEGSHSSNNNKFENLTSLGTQTLQQFNKSVLFDLLNDENPRKRLIFSDECLYTLVLRSSSSNLPPANTTKSKNKKNNFNQEHWPDELGVIGSMVLGQKKLIADMTYTYKRMSNLTNTTHHATNNGNNNVEVKQEESDLVNGLDCMVYFLRPGDVKSAKAIAKKIKRCQSLSAKLAQQNPELLLQNSCKHKIIHVPNGSSLTNAVFEEEELLNLISVSIHELPIDLVPLDKDVWSMEIAPSCTIMECFIDEVPSFTITSVARSMLKLQQMYGVFHKVESLGPLSESVLSKMLSLRVEEYEGDNSASSGLRTSSTGGYDDTCSSSGGDTTKGMTQSSSEIEAMMIIDRQIDLVTPMLTPLTYEGLVDEVLGIRNGFVKVERSLVDPEAQESEKAAAGPGAPSISTNTTDKNKVSLPLNDCDPLFKEVRGQNVEKFGSFLQDQAKALKDSHANFTSKDKSLSEIHKFVKHIPIFTQNYRSLTQHINLAEMVKRAVNESSFRERWQTEREMVEGETCYDFIESMIHTDEPPLRVLRLLCLQSLTNGGIKSSRYDSLRRDFIQTYGYEYLFLMTNLEKMGAIRAKAFLNTTDPAFSMVRKSMQLINANVDPIDPEDIAYVSSGYAPLSVRLIQASCKGWVGKDEVLREIPGRLIDIIQKHPPKELTKLLSRSVTPGLQPLTTVAESSFDGGGGSHHNDNNKPVLLVYYVGGVTFMEIAAMRFLSSSPKFPYKIICCTTQVLNGNTLVESVA